MAPSSPLRGWGQPLCAKVMNIVYVTIAVFVLYVFGFFASPPIAMTATTTQVPVLIRVTHGVTHALYSSWIRGLSEDNVIGAIWGANVMFWCNNFETCNAGEPENT